ncbi:MAG TPA: NAD-dependent epimerase/dehydratase family protein [Actinomycetota bacterium]|nr:NAD-dependent epimerase/dehydratase family protein [Actinomycetota bacterium]
MTADGIHVVLGASGGTGNAVAGALADRGLAVRGVNRAGDADLPEGVERVAADVTSAEQLRRAVDGAEVVYHCAQPEYTRWAEDFPPMNGAIVRATAEVGAKLVFADNLYMYGAVDGPMTEDTPVRPTSKKGQVRAALARDLLEAHRTGVLRVAIGRASDYFGPRAPDSAIGERVFGAAVLGKKVPWLGSLDRPHTVSYSEDIGRAIAILGERGEADGRVWHLPAGEPVTGRAFVELISKALGRPLRPTVTGAGMVKLAGLFVPMIREIDDVMDQWTRPFVADDSRFQRAFGPFPVTPIDEAVRRTVAWYRERAAGPPS